MQSTPERKPCGTCGNEYTVTRDGVIRHHFTENPEFQAGPDSRKCKGAGQPPASAAGIALAEDMEAGQRQCRLCKHPVELTGNGRARSHLTPEQTPRQCPGGSDFPLGDYPDILGTTDGLVATLAADCEHVPVGQCYGCHGAAGAAPWGVDPATVQQPTMADQFKAPAASVTCGCGASWPSNEEMQKVGHGLTQCPKDRAAGPSMVGEYTYPAVSPLTALLERETVSAGTVLDVMDGDTRTEAEQFMGAAVPAQPTASRDPQCEKCDTDNHRCPGCGTDVKHGTVACGECTARVDAERDRRQAMCSHPDGFDDSLRIGGRDVPVCEHCNAVAPTSKLPVGETDDGRPCDHSDGLFGMEDGKTVCAACGTPCTHPDGFQGTADDVDEDGQDRVVSTCTICGTVDPEGVDDSAEDDPHVRLGELDEGDYFLRRGTLMRLTERESRSSVLAEVMDGPHKGRTGELKNPDEVVQRAPEPQAVQEPDPRDVMGQVRRDAKAVRETEQRAESGPVRVGELEEGDHFTRRGTLMRVTGETNGVVHAVVVEGPHKGRTGDLPNLGETVDRAPCRHSYAWGDDGKFGHSGSFCEYCGAGDPATEMNTEQETKECTDDRTATSPRSSAASTRTTTRATTAPAPGSPRATGASAPAVSPKSKSVTSSAPTARAAGNGRSAAVTTDQSAAAAAFLGSGRPAVPATNGAQNQADAAAQFLAGGSGAHGEKETKRDRFGRYLIPHPDTGKEQAWTRATTFAKSISDTYALSQWGLRMALLGATMRPDIVQRAHGKHVSADKALLDELTADLKNAAGDKVAANKGTAMHSFTELADRAWHSPGGPRSVLDQVPPDCRADVETYIRLLEETGLEPVPHLIEFTTVVKQYGVAGTSDNCYKVTKPLVLRIGRAEVRLEPGEYVIGDKKTGKDLSYGWQEIAIQLGTYAQGINTAGVWDRQEEVWEPDPLSRFDKPGTKVRLDAGIVIHLPVDKGGDKAPAVYGIDLESGWNAAVLCERVRAWRKVRTLAAPVMVSEADTFAPTRPEPTVTTRTTVRPPTLRDKALAVTSKGDASAVWKEAKTAGLSDAEVDELVALMQNRLKELAEPGG